MPAMTSGRWKNFVLETLHTAKLATVNEDGRPHVAPIWFDLDGEDLVFTTGEQSTKGRAIRRDPRVCLCVDDERPPFSFVMIEGAATITVDPEQLLYWATRIGGRYMGRDKAEFYGERNTGPGEMVVRVRPTRVVGYERIAV